MAHLSVTLCPVPTIKQRITITATGDLERILDAQARLHPDLSPSALVAMLVERGHACLKIIIVFILHVLKYTVKHIN